MIPDYIRERILRPIPQDCCVPDGLIPQVAEGYLEKARIATVGLNPKGARSRKEYSPEGEFDLDEAGLQKAWQDKRQYFESNYYRPYFGPLEKILNACGASYGGLCGPNNPSAVSLDLVQWATDPSSWSELPYGVPEKLLEEDKAFFGRLLTENPNIELVLAISRRVVEELKYRHGAQIIGEETRGSFL